MVSTPCTFCGHVGAYVCKAWLVDCCCLSVAGQSLLSHLCVYDRFGLELHAICVHFVCVDAHACKAWLVDCCCLSVVCQSCFFICVSMIDFGWHGVQFVHFVCMWLHMLASLVCGLLLLVCGLTKLAVSLLHL